MDVPRRGLFPGRFGSRRCERRGFRRRASRRRFGPPGHGGGWPPGPPRAGGRCREFRYVGDFPQGPVSRRGGVMGFGPRGRPAGPARSALARGAGRLQVEFAFPEQGRESRQSLGDVPEPSGDQRHQRPHQPPSLAEAAARILGDAEPLAQVGEAVCRGGEWRIFHVIMLVWLGVGGQGESVAGRFGFCHRRGMRLALASGCSTAPQSSDMLIKSVTRVQAPSVRCRHLPETPRSNHQKHHSHSIPNRASTSSTHVSL